MTQTLSLRSLFAAGAFAAVASISLFGTSGQANASVLECKGNTPGAVLACCQEEVKRNGKPMWMRVNQSSCNKSAVVCRGKYSVSANVKRCWYNPTFAKIDSDDKGGGRGRGQGGKP